MINELYVLSQNLKKCDIFVKDQNQDVKTPGKGEGFVVGVSDKGLPVSIEKISSDQMVRLWKISKGKHHSFPYIKLKKPIWEVEIREIEEVDKADKNGKEDRNRIAALKKSCARKNLSKKQDVSMSQWTNGKIQALPKDSRLTALTELNNRFPKEKVQSDAFLRELSELILQNASGLKLDLCVTLLIGKIKVEKSVKKIVCDVPIFFDLSDWSNKKYPCRVASPEMRELVVANLGGNSSPNNTQGISALSGENQKLHTGPYPDPTLPIIGSTYLFSMNEDIPCHVRYGKISSEIFPASEDEIKAMNGALNWCVDAKRKGKTWKGIPNSKGKQDLLISYLEEKPQEEIDLASCFTSFDVLETETAEGIYEEKSRMVCATLEGKKGLKRDSKVNVLVLTKIDLGRAQVVISSSYSIGNIIQSNETWRLAAQNRPYFSIYLPAKKGEQPKLAEPFCPSPSEVMKCLQTQWIKNGLDRRDVPGIALRYVYELFLGQGRIAQETARMLLCLVLQRLGPLFIGVASADHSGYIDIKDFKSDARRATLIGISLLAIVLYKLGIKKEDYMKNAAFNVGRLLSFADSLHAQYCKIQMGRKGNDLPPQLIGNALLPVAFDNPNKALVRLGDRLRIYYAWATKVQGEDYKLVKWIMSEMGKISACLEGVSWPKMTDDAVKAQVLLGYLARAKSEE